LSPTKHFGWNNVSKFLVTKETKPVETLVLPAPAGRPNKVAANGLGLCVRRGIWKTSSRYKSQIYVQKFIVFPKPNL
jgi:hypothetical protein